jgi:hypothetical protein
MARRLLPFLPQYGRHNKGVANNEEFVLQNIAPWYFADYPNDHEGSDGTWTDDDMNHRVEVSSCLLWRRDHTDTLPANNDMAHERAAWFG